MGVCIVLFLSCFLCVVRLEHRRRKTTSSPAWFRYKASVWYLISELFLVCGQA